MLPKTNTMKLSNLLIGQLVVNLIFNCINMIHVNTLINEINHSLVTLWFGYVGYVLTEKTGLLTSEEKYYLDRFFSPFSKN